LSKFGEGPAGKPWQAVREGVDVKLAVAGQETLRAGAKRRARIHKERAMPQTASSMVMGAPPANFGQWTLDREELLMNSAPRAASNERHGV